MCNLRSYVPGSNYLVSAYTVINSGRQIWLDVRPIEHLREMFYRHALEYLQSARSEKKWKKKKKILRKRPNIIGLFEGLWLVGTRFRYYYVMIAPDLKTSTPKKKLAMSPSSAAHGGQYDTKNVTSEWLSPSSTVVHGGLYDAKNMTFMVGDKLEPARIYVVPPFDQDIP